MSLTRRRDTRDYAIREVPPDEAGPILQRYVRIAPSTRRYFQAAKDSPIEAFAIEYALVSYDWGEAFTALNLVLAPTLDDVLLTQLGQVAKDKGDDLTWQVNALLGEDSRRRSRWSRALADLAVAQRPENRAVLAKWVSRWSALGDDAALGLGTILQAAAGVPAADVAARARLAREDFLAGLLTSGFRLGAGKLDRLDTKSALNWKNRAC